MATPSANATHEAPAPAVVRSAPVARMQRVVKRHDADVHSALCRRERPPFSPKSMLEAADICAAALRASRGRGIVIPDTQFFSNAIVEVAGPQLERLDVGVHGRNSQFILDVAKAVLALSKQLRRINIELCHVSPHLSWSALREVANAVKVCRSLRSLQWGFEGDLTGARAPDRVEFLQAVFAGFDELASPLRTADGVSPPAPLQEVVLYFSEAFVSNNVDEKEVSACNAIYDKLIALPTIKFVTAWPLNLIPDHDWSALRDAIRDNRLQTLELPHGLQLEQWRSVLHTALPNSSNLKLLVAGCLSAEHVPFVALNKYIAELEMSIDPMDGSERIVLPPDPFPAVRELVVEGAVLQIAEIIAAIPLLQRLEFARLVICETDPISPLQVEGVRSAFVRAVRHAPRGWNTFALGRDEEDAKLCPNHAADVLTALGEADHALMELELHGSIIDCGIRFPEWQRMSRRRNLKLEVPQLPDIIADTLVFQPNHLPLWCRVTVLLAFVRAVGSAHPLRLSVLPLLAAISGKESVLQFFPFVGAVADDLGLIGYSFLASYFIGNSAGGAFALERLQTFLTTRFARSVVSVPDASHSDIVRTKPGAPAPC